MMNFQTEIVRMLNKGYSRNEVFFAILEKPVSKNWNQKARQELADQIAQTDELDVYATGVVPPSEVQR